MISDAGIVRPTVTWRVLMKYTVFFFWAWRLTCTEAVLYAVLEDYYFLVLVQSRIRESGCSLCEFLLHFGRQAKHCLWLL